MSLSEEQWFKLKETRKIYNNYLKGRLIWPRKDSFYKSGNNKVYQMPYIKAIHGVIGSKKLETLQKQKSVDDR
jgi:hypothetical protein